MPEETGQFDIKSTCFAPRTAQMILIVFCRDTCVEKSVADLPPRTAAKK
jgi:hypothetical protein